MTDLATAEYAALRETIRSRGTLRPLAFLAGFTAWGVALLLVLAWVPNPLASAVPLTLLLATFEVVRSVHLGVERIGRYIQVNFEETSRGGGVTTPPMWEHAAMRFGPSVPGAGGHPYYLLVFVAAAAVNFLAVLLPGPVALELVALGVPHAALLVWILYCDRGMRRQRAAELARFRALKEPSPAP